MKLGMNFSQSQTQSQIIAPQMIQAMKILQMPLSELQERLEQEIDENPVLEFTERTSDDVPADEMPAPEEEAYDTDQALTHDDNNASDFERLEAMDREMGGVFEEPRVSREKLEEMGDRKLEAMANMPDRPQSLQDYLTEQLPFLDLDDDLRDLVDFLVSSLDDKGFLRDPLEKLAFVHERPVTVAELEDALAVIHKLDPAGVGARDLKECLSIQITDELCYPDLVRDLIRDHLEDIQFNRIAQIAAKTGEDIDDVVEAIAELKTFNPRPASGFSVQSTHYVVPDIIIEKNENTGELLIRLADDWMPDVTIPQRFIQMAKDRGNEKSVRDYLKDKLQSAMWLRDAIAQRRATLEKVAREIVTHQRAFFEKGPDFLEPLKMQEIADRVGVHVTTVSRAVDNKWLQSSRGVFPLKRFFAAGTRNELTGVDIAWESIRRKLQEFIDAEDKTAPLSDEALEGRFQAVGLEVARRTVTKYRKLMNIPSSRERRVS